MAILLVYGNTFQASWHLDDVTNIVENKNIRVHTWDPGTWSRAIRSPFTPESRINETIYRPVAMATFAFNWALDQYNVVGYHLVNIGIHCATSILLYFTLLGILSAPALQEHRSSQKHFIALLAAALWALHPIQTQAVTYIVQRMAVLAAFFYLAGIYFFIQARTADKTLKKILFFGLVLISYLLAIGSKEHAITLPASLLLMELVFFHKPNPLKSGKSAWIIFSAVVVGGLLLLALLWSWKGNPMAFILKSYQPRPFTLSERLLTEPRVLVFYLTQLFYPIPQQFSIMHDFSVSRSLFDPLSTAICIGIILLLILYAVSRLRRRPLLSFAILFFFLTHSVESSLLGLELVFEHRNYLPSMFLFLPVAAGLIHLVDDYRQKLPALHVCLLCFITFLIMSLGAATYIRNSVWATEETLWADALRHAPNQARSYQNLGMYADRTSRYEEALICYAKALQMKDPQPELARFISLSNMGNIHKKMFQYHQAATYLREAIKFDGGPDTPKVIHNLVLCLLNTDGETEALAYLNRLIAKERDNPAFLSTRGFIFFKQGRYQEALSDLGPAIKFDPSDKNALLVMGMALSKIGDYLRADGYLEQALQRNTKNLVSYLARLENALRMKNTVLSNKVMADMLRLFPVGEIEIFFEHRAKKYNYINDTLVPLNDTIVMPALADYICKTAQRLQQNP